MQDRDALANKIRERRKALNLGQRELAELAGISRSALALYEQGKRRFTLLALSKLAPVLGLPLDELIADLAHHSGVAEEWLVAASAPKSVLGQQMHAEKWLALLRAGSTPGDKLRIARETMSPRLTQEKAAEVLGITRATLANYESGRVVPSNQVLSKAADHWKLPVHWFLLPIDAADERTQGSSNKWFRAIPDKHFTQIPRYGTIPGEIDEERVEALEDFIDVPGFLSDEDNYATELITPRGRLRAGDLLVCRNTLVQRPGRIMVITRQNFVDLGVVTPSFDVVPMPGHELHGPRDQWTTSSLLVAVLRSYEVTHGTVEWDFGGLTP